LCWRPTCSAGRCEQRGAIKVYDEFAQAFELAAQDGALEFC
jgi:hypothetical protein